MPSVANRPTAALMAVAAFLLGTASGLNAQRVAPHQEMDGVLAAYAGGDVDIVKRTFKGSLDFRRLQLLESPQWDRWLGAWNPVKASLWLEIAHTSAGIAPHYSVPLLLTGQRYIVRAAGPGGAPERFGVLWHQSAIGILLRRFFSTEVDQYAAVLLAAGKNGQPAGSARIVLARGLAQEQHCWRLRPTVSSIDARSESDRARDRERASLCLQETLKWFQQAARSMETACEARVRMAWTLLQLGQHAEARRLLDAEDADAGDDRALHYWAALFRGRLDLALGHPAAAESEFRSALTLFPNAQSAGIGLTLALSQQRLDDEAQRTAMAVRSHAARAPDPWWNYFEGDGRFVNEWIKELRVMAGLRGERP